MGWCGWGTGAPGPDRFDALGVWDGDGPVSVWIGRDPGSPGAGVPSDAWGGLGGAGAGAGDASRGSTPMSAIPACALAPDPSMPWASAWIGSWDCPIHSGRIANTAKAETTASNAAATTQAKTRRPPLVGDLKAGWACRGLALVASSLALEADGPDAGLRVRAVGSAGAT